MAGKKGRNGGKSCDPIVHFLANIVHVAGPGGGCWLWMGARDNNGYGRISVNGRRSLLHRFSYEKFMGSIPEGLVIDHLCRTHRCANPEHLEPVTSAVNIQRGMNNNREKDACPKGHAYTEINTQRDHHGYRYCKQCKRDRRTYLRANGLPVQ